MINPFRPLWLSLKDLFDELLLLIACNVLWCVFSLPLLWLAYLGLVAEQPIAAALTALVGVLPLGPATAGLTYVTNRVSEGRATKIREFFVGMRQYARNGWVLMGIWVFGLLVIVFDIAFYLGVDNILAALVLGLWIYLLAIWLALLIYIFPLMLLQEVPSLRLIARNGILMVVGRPIFTLITIVLMVVILGLSAFVIVPFVLISVAFVNLWSIRATRTLVEDAERRKEAAAGGNQPEVGPEEKGRKGQVRPK